jgi:hypothetical protein
MMQFVFESLRGACVMMACLLTLRFLQWAGGVAVLASKDWHAALAEIHAEESFPRFIVWLGTLLLSILTLAAFLQVTIADVVTYLKPMPKNVGGGIVAVGVLLMLLSFRWINCSPRPANAWRALALVLAVSSFVEFSQWSGIL